MVGKNEAIQDEVGHLNHNISRLESRHIKRINHKKYNKEEMGLARLLAKTDFQKH